MNVVDSSGWLEFCAEGPNADCFALSIENVLALVDPSVSLYEVVKRVRQQRGEDAAVQAVGIMAQGCVVDVSIPLALNAAKIAVDLRLPMADSIMLATARAIMPRCGPRVRTSEALRGCNMFKGVHERAAEPRAGADAVTRAAQY